MESHEAPKDRSAPLLAALDEALDSANDTQCVGLLLVRIENLERLMSAFGYRVGAEITSASWHRLCESARAQDVAVQISDSDFAIVVRGARNAGHLTLAANKISQALGKPIAAGQSKLTPEVRCGISIGPLHAASGEGLLQHAHAARLTAVRNDTRYCLYSPDQSLDVRHSLALESEFDGAIERGELEFHYQAKISTADMRPCGAEALMRWTNPARGPIEPKVFIPFTDSVAHVEAIAAFTLNTSLREATEWPVGRRYLSVSINVTPKVIASVDLVALVSNALRLWNADAGNLFIEITEGTLMANREVSFRILHELRNLGAHVSIDDFGTGYSSLSYFKDIPADELKIDRCFVSNMLDNEGDNRIVRATMDLARQFGLMVTAEGVPDQRTAQALVELGCDHLQGYYFSRPLPQKAFCDWLCTAAPLSGRLDAFENQHDPVRPTETHGDDDEAPSSEPLDATGTS